MKRFVERSIWSMIGSTIVATLILAVSPEASAADFCVSNSAELAQALSVAEGNGEDDTIKIVQGIYSGTFEYDSAETGLLSIEGGYDAQCGEKTVDADNTVIDAGQAGPALALTSSSDPEFSIEGVTLQNGKNIASGGGGLRIVTAMGDVTIDYMKVKNCRSDYQGGGIFIQGAEMTNITNSSITGNVSGENSATGYGGGLFIDSSLMVILRECDISDNQGDETGGFYADLSVAATIGGCDIQGNTGRGAWVSAWQTSFGGCVICQNDAQGLDGGGFYVAASFPMLQNNRIYGNKARRGGGFFCEGDEAQIDGNYVYENEASEHGGGFFASQNEELYIANNLVVENLSGENGHGFFIDRPDFAAISNNTVVANAKLESGAGGAGGGMHMLLYNNGDRAELENNIFWSNSADTCSDIFIDDDCNDDQVYSAVSILNSDFDRSDAGFCILQDFSFDPSNLNKIDPLFIDAQGMDYRLDPLSLCIDAGDELQYAPTFDIDMADRPVGQNYDMGAYESVFNCELEPVALGEVKYSDLRACFEAIAGDGDVICVGKIFVGDFEIPVAAGDSRITLAGGYDCSLSFNDAPNYVSAIDGSLTLSGGAVTIDKFVIQ